MRKWWSRAFAVVVFLATGAVLHAKEFSLGAYCITLPDGFVNEPGKGYDTLLGAFRNADGKMRVEYSLELEYNGSQSTFADADKNEIFLTPLGEGMLRNGNGKEGGHVDFLLPPDLKLSWGTPDGTVPAWFKGMLESLTSSDATMVSVAKSMVTADRDDEGKGVLLSVK